MRNAHATPELDDRHVGSPGHGSGGDFQHHSSTVGWLHLKVSPATGEQKGWRKLERGCGCLEGEGVLTTHLTSISRWRLFRRGLHCSLANLRLQCTYYLLTVTRTDKCVQQFYMSHFTWLSHGCLFLFCCLRFPLSTHRMLIIIQKSSNTRRRYVVLRI